MRVRFLSVGCAIGLFRRDIYPLESELSETNRADCLIGAIE